MSHYIIDPLSNIAKLNHPVADLVRDYLASEQDWKVDGWFIDRVETFFRNDEKDSAVQSSLDTADIDKSVFAKNKVRLVSILPHYFRGFRNVEHAIDLSGDLVVIDGRNSSGKTSLAEAIEWVLTNGISRRSSGDPKELSDCIANRFKLDTNETWVELVLDKDGDQITLRRLLVKDYDSRKDSLCESRVLMNGKEITDSSEEMVSLFVGVPPLIMQHSLMQLVVQNPTERRNYFERLLNLDRITSLIQNAVVGDERLARITRDQGGKCLENGIN